MENKEEEYTTNKIISTYYYLENTTSTWPRYSSPPSISSSLLPYRQPRDDSTKLTKPKNFSYLTTSYYTTTALTHHFLPIHISIKSSHHSIIRISKTRVQPKIILIPMQIYKKMFKENINWYLQQLRFY